MGRLARHRFDFAEFALVLLVALCRILGVLRPRQTGQQLRQVFDAIALRLDRQILLRTGRQPGDDDGPEGRHLQAAAVLGHPGSDGDAIGAHAGIVGHGRKACVRIAHAHELGQQEDRS